MSRKVLIQNFPNSNAIVYNADTKNIESQPSSDPTYFQIEINKIIDMYNVGNDLYIIQIVAYLANNNAFVIKKFTNTNLTFSNGNIFSFIYSFNSKSILQLQSDWDLQRQTGTLYMDNANQYNTLYFYYINPITDTTTPLDSYCIDTTLRQVMLVNYYNIQYADIQNSPSCGFIIPDANIQLTEKKLILIDKNCYQNEIVLKFKNLYGGYDNYKFHWNQQSTYVTKDLGYTKNYYNDIEDIEGSYTDLGKSVTSTLILGADNLTTDDFIGIRNHLLPSPAVYVIPKRVWVSTGTTGGIYIYDYFNQFIDDDFNIPISDTISIVEQLVATFPEKRKKVTINSGTFKSFTRDKLHNIEFEILLPEPLTLRN